MLFNLVYRNPGVPFGTCWMQCFPNAISSGNAGVQGAASKMHAEPVPKSHLTLRLPTMLLTLCILTTPLRHRACDSIMESLAPVSVFHLVILITALHSRNSCTAAVLWMGLSIGYPVACTVFIGLWATERELKILVQDNYQT